MVKKRKSLAQLPYGSKEWDEEMERQSPGWSAQHGVLAKVLEWPVTEARLKRLRDADKESHGKAG